MEVSYYPGCTLKTNGKNFEVTTLKLLEKLDVDVKELEEWYCCGVTFSQSEENLIQKVAPIRTLVKAKEAGRKKLLVLCAMCYNTLKRAVKFIKDNPDKRDVIHDFMDRESTKYFGDEVEIIDLLSLLKLIGREKIREVVRDKRLNLKVAGYYGCMLLRPRDIAIDSETNPTVLEEMLENFGLSPVYFPFRVECCGSYQILNNSDLVRKQTRLIVSSAIENGADFIVTLCPLCFYNLDEVQKEIAEEDSAFKTIPVMYISQLLSIAAGISPEINDFNLHSIDPRPVLREKGLL